MSATSAIPLDPAPVAASIALRTRAGHGVAPDASSWRVPASPVDRRVLARARGPVLDVGCGPGRHLAALHRSGVAVLGLDVSPAAVAVARTTGAPVREGCVFDAVPLEGTWRTVLLLDGNVGIGGDATALLARVRALLAPAGLILAEVAAPGLHATRHEVRLELDGTAGPWFAFATVPASDAGAHAAAAGLAVTEAWQDDARHFVSLRPETP